MRSMGATQWSLLMFWSYSEEGDRDRPVRLLTAGAEGSSRSRLQNEMRPTFIASGTKTQSFLRTLIGEPC